MATDLKAIPQRMLLPSHPDKFRWLTIVTLITLLGAIFSLAVWPATVSTHSLWFWFCSLILPLSAGLTAYALRLRQFENQRDRILYWNQMHQQETGERVAEGQLAAGLLAVAYATPLVNHKLADALMAGFSPLQTRFDLQQQCALTSASLSPAPATVTSDVYQARLITQLTGVMRQLQSELSMVSGNPGVRIRHDGTLTDAEMRLLWGRLFPALSQAASIDISHREDGLSWLGDWLDKRPTAHLLSVEINLFQALRHRQAESVSALLLASPERLSDPDHPPLAWIHRPVVLTEAGEAIEESARWGRLVPGESFTLWRAQAEGETLTGALRAMERGGFAAGCKDDRLLDDSFGRPGAAVGNIALICAGEHAASQRQAQWLMVGDITTQMAIVRPA